MENSEIIEKIAFELESGSAKTKSFEQICGAIGVSVRRADSCIAECLGIDGRTVTECYRLGVPASVLIPGFSSRPR